MSWPASASSTGSLTDPDQKQEKSAQRRRSATPERCGNGVRRGRKRGTRIQPRACQDGHATVPGFGLVDGNAGARLEGVGDQVLRPWLQQPIPRSRAGRYASTVGEVAGGAAVPSSIAGQAVRRIPW